MTERTIQNALFEELTYRKGYRLACPNYTLPSWFECDLFAVTKAEFAVEFEIKISKSDFKADVKKGPSERFKKWAMYSNNRHDLRSKHERLAAADPFGPSRFFYVVPEGMVTVEEIPAWAGLIYANKREAHHEGPIRIFLREIKKAPKLHRHYVPAKVTDHARSVFYYRFWNLRRGMSETAADDQPQPQPQPKKTTV